MNTDTISERRAPGDAARPVRCLLGMVGTDVHSKGIRTIAQILRDAGVEVIYIGEHNTIEGMAQAVVDEDADVVGLSFSSAAYVTYTGLLIEAMHARDVNDVPLMLGGLIHPDDVPVLTGMGVAGIFGPGSSTEQIIAFVKNCG
jgi:methylmalonyl-CoA mutase C-terminal domain/subunit